MSSLFHMSRWVMFAAVADLFHLICSVRRPLLKPLLIYVWLELCFFLIYPLICSAHHPSVFNLCVSSPPTHSLSSFSHIRPPSDPSPSIRLAISLSPSYDRSCSQHPPPLSRGAGPPLSLALPRSLASEDSRQTLHSTPSSFTDRER